MTQRSLVRIEPGAVGSGAVEPVVIEPGGVERGAVEPGDRTPDGVAHA
jgi:hypothetical protein